MSPAGAAEAGTEQLPGQGGGRGEAFQSGHACYLKARSDWLFSEGLLKGCGDDQRGAEVRIDGEGEGG